MLFWMWCLCWTIAACQSDEIIFNYNNTYKYDVQYIVEVSRNVEYIMEFGGEDGAADTPARVTVASGRANRSDPVFITARQQKGVFSWQLPLVVEAAGGPQEFSNVSRTLCPHNDLFARDERACEAGGGAALVHVSTSSAAPVRVGVLLQTVRDFYVRLDDAVNVTVSPSQPQYYFYPFDQGPDARLDLAAEAESKRQFCAPAASPASPPPPPPPRSGWLERPRSVIVTIESDDDICALISIQNYSCPVFDNERDILYDGYYLTMTRRGGITLTQDTFPRGFYIVFIVKSSDEACTGNASAAAAPADTRIKTFRLKVIETISYVEYMVGAGAALGFFLAFYAAWLLTVLLQRRCRAPHADGGSAVLVEGARTPPARRRRAINDAGAGTRSSCSDTESESSTGGGDGAAAAAGTGALRLASLARSRARVLAARSRLYLWTVLTVAVFYTLPVAQLAVTYQRLLNRAGDQDLCYFNFLCAHPLGPLSDFNHVYSNVGYVLLGALFLLQVRRRGGAGAGAGRGIPQHRGLLYAMGAALAAEGLLSAAYHVCPNSMNFQFDTSFMYVTAALGMVRLYQARHPDINARAHATFAALALVMAIGVAGVLSATPAFWAAFTALHLLACLVLTFQIYYLGRFRLEKRVVSRAWGALAAVRRRGLAAVTPTHAGRCVMLLLANLANWALAAYGLSTCDRDFASHLLKVMLGNLFLYTLFYIGMKLLTGERLRAHSWAWVAAAHAAWAAAAYFYLDLNTNWALTPAESRRENRACSLLRLYDAHDAWHFLSATAMFCSFNMYLTLDDNLAAVPRDQISVF